MGELNESGLEKAIKTVSSGEDKDLVKTAIDDIVEFMGWDIRSAQGQLLGYGIEEEIKLMKDLPRKNLENYAQHTIIAAKLVSKVTDYKDITIVFGALKHDDIEENKKYKKKERKYNNAKNNSKREEILKEAIKIKKKCLDRTRSFFNNIDDKLILESGIDVESVIEIEDGLTKRPDEFYYKYQERLCGRDRKSKPKDEELLNILRSTIIKTRGDRFHNNSTIPRADYKLEGDVRNQENKFTIAQRLKECYKSLTTINRGVNLVRDYPNAQKKYNDHVNYLIDSKHHLIEVASGVVNEDIKYLTTLIGKDITSKIDILFSQYEDYRIRAAATYTDIMEDPKRIFDGTLERYDNWIRKKYKKGVPKPENIEVSSANKTWMEKYLGIDDPNKRLLVQGYMDCLAFAGTFKKFKEDPEYILKGFRRINK